jgi:hypothetical protein
MNEKCCNLKNFEPNGVVVDCYPALLEGNCKVCGKSMGVFEDMIYEVSPTCMEIKFK